MPLNRRKFLKNTALAGGALISNQLFGIDYFDAKDKTVSLTILHTNDVHSRLEPFPMDGSRNQGLGGIAARTNLIKQIRSEVDNVLLLDAGDMFQGTAYFNLYKGEAEIKAMSYMGYDAGTIGNHDFDGGIENLSNQLVHANFPLINCNYQFNDTPLHKKVLPYTIIEKGGAKIGILGVGIALEGLVPENLYGNTKYFDPIVKANETAELLTEKGCDFILCLSHLGDKYEDGKVSDEVLAKNTKNIDLIIGGHTHRFFNEPIPYTNLNGGTTLVNQVGWGGIMLGRLDYSIHLKHKRKQLKSNNTVIVKK
ncbi:MAG: bifunctional metallophosphatase/5'-nucleotidase [Chitinophagaceae bacterium]